MNLAELDALCDTIADIGASFDLIDLVDHAAHDVVALARGRGLWKRIEFERGCPAWRGIDVERELKRLSIGVCGRGFTKNTLFCYVPAEQHRWADYVLRRAGVPLVGNPVDPRNVEWAAGKGPVPQWDGRAPVQPAGEDRERVTTRTRNDGKRKASGRKRRGILARLLRWLGWEG